MHAQMLNRLNLPGIPECLRTIPALYKTGPQETTRVEQAVLWPHLLVSAIHKHFPAVFQQRILGGSAENVARFWSSMGDNPAYTGHPMRERDNHRTKCIPLSLHGDGVAVSGVQRVWSKTADIISFTSMLGKGPTISTNFMIILWYWEKLVPNHLVPEFFKRLKWSLQWAYRGDHPDRDWNGRLYTPADREYSVRLQPLADGYFFTLFGIRGDLEWMHKVFSFPIASQTRAGCCGECPANDTTFPWTDCRPEAVWKRNLFGHLQWIVDHPNCLAAVLFSLPGVGIYNYIPDVMHCKHLGTDSYYFGSILVYLIHYIMPGSVDDNLETIWGEIKLYYQATTIYIYKQIY